ncbi:Nonribosomal peptide synthase atnA [Colletotrichum sp. SAR 10_86]|nr:Nonribosomal peptide synthase atnA [Colletotrichum sp. SAR 10_76]KAI8227070.1 Nonribosomal peptide synthase atnA [Colletotrichum sp. SAR 10_86]
MSMTNSSLLDDPAILAQICEQCQISPKDIQDVYPCTPLQSGMMVDSSLYVHVIVHKIDPSVDTDRLCGAIDQVVASNAVLRTRIVDCDGAGLLQAVVKGGEPVLRSTETDLERFLERNNSVRTDLGTPLIRFALVRCSTEDGGTRLVTTLHHVMFDFHVMEFLMDDTWSIYQGIAPPLHAPFKDFVEHCAAIDSKEAVAFWRGRFKNGASIFPPLPAHNHQVLANEVLTRDISFASDKSSTTLPSTALMPAYIEAAWAMAISDYTSNDSIAFGCILSGRGSGQPGGAETTFGPTIATVPVQVDLRRNMTIQQLVKGRVASRRELSTSPFLQYGLRRIRNISGDAQQASSFQSVLNIVHRAHTAGLGTSGLSLDAAYTEEPPKPYGLLLICAPGEKHISVKTLFDPAVLAREQVNRILRQLEHRLRQLVTCPPSTPLKRLPCLNFGDTLELMDWNSQGFPKGPPVDVCLHSRVFARAAEQPNALAVKSWDGEATYAELVTMVDNLAHEILAARQGSVTAEEPICLILGRSLSLVVSLLAVMRIGGTCVPIDPNLPDGRKEAILRQCRAHLILTSSDSLGLDFQRGYITHAVILNRAKDVTRLTADMDVNTPSSRAAYILFTSGSTGQPKGVVLEHRSLASTLTAWADVLGWSTSSTVLQFSAPAWDACALEIFGSLLAGACVCIPSDMDRESGLGVYIRSAQVEFAVLTPTALRNLAPEDVLPVLQTLVSAGEPITRRVFETWAGKVRLFNAWGPCEASVVASMGHLPPDARYPDTVGTPVGCAVWIVDPEDASRLLPIGAMGEMLIDGPGVAREYHLAPELTKASFIKLPSFVPRRKSGLDSPHHLYRSGDLARYNADGTIAFGGRRDNQVKVRGQRFELGEVEAVLASHQSVSKVVVTTQQTRSGSANKELVAVLTFDEQHIAGDKTGASESEEMNRIHVDDESRNQLQAIREFAGGCLPMFMVPTAWLVVSGFPLTPSRKVDRVKIQAFLDTVDMSTARADTVRSNPQPASSRTMEDGHQVLTPPVTPAEVALQLAWSSVLGIDPSKIGRESSLMQLGGDSITAMQVATRCRKQGFQIAVADLLRTPTLAEAAKEVQQTAQETLSTAIPVMDMVEESQHRPLSAIQKFLVDDGGPAAHNQFNQAFLLDLHPSMAVAATPALIQKALGKLVAYHPMLRCRFSHVEDDRGNSTLTQWIAPSQQQEDGEATWSFRVHRDVGSHADLGAIVSSSQSSLNIIQGPVFAADVIVSPQGKVSILLVAHHLVIDLMSWRILWEDLEMILQDDACVLPPSLPFPVWLQSQRDMLKSGTASPLSSSKTSSVFSSSSPSPDSASSLSRVSSPPPSLWPKADRLFWKMDNVTPKMRNTLRISYTLDQEQTAQVMGPACNLPFNTTPVVLLLTAVVLSFRRVFPDRGTPAVYCEGHGRDKGFVNKSVDTSRTIGWFTTLFPLSLQALGVDSRIDDAVMAIKDEYLDTLQTATEQFASEVLGEQTSFKRSNIELIFNFAGRLQQFTRDDALLKIRTDGPPVHLENVTGDSEPVGLLSLFASVSENDELTFTLEYDRHMAHQDRVARWIQTELGNCFREMTSTLPGSQRRLTTSDLPLLKLDSGSLEHLHAQLAGLQIVQDNVESIYPCTATQEGILLAQISGHDYHNRFLSRLTSSDGDINPDRIADAWKAVCKKHSILRTVFTNGLSDQGGFQQVVLKAHEPSISIEQMPADGSTIAQVLALREKRALDPKKPPHHLALFRESASVVYAALDISHTIVAARTYQDLWRNVGREYAQAHRSGRAAVTPGRPFSDYVVWLQGQEQEARQHWKEYLEGVKPCVFPLDLSAASGYRARGPIVPFSDAQQLNSFCQGQGITSAMFMQAAWALVLWKHTGNSTVCFGVSRSDQEVLPGVDDTSELLGPCISMLPCKFSLDNPASMTAINVLQAARNAAYSAMSYSGCYLAELHDDLGLRDSPLFDTAMTVQRAWPADLGGDGGHLAVETMDGEDPTEFSIVVGVSYSDSGVTIRLAHERARVSDQMIERIAETFARVIEYMIQTPHEPLVQLDKYSSLPAGFLDLVKQWNAEPPVTAAYSNVVSAFRAMTRSQGSAPAVCSWDGDLTYSELDRLSDHLAYKLRVEHGVRSQTVVAFCCIKATSAVVIMLAVWKAGGAFLALDINHPPERRTAILREAEATLILVNTPERVDTMKSCFPGGAVDLVDPKALEKFTPDDANIVEELSSFKIDSHHAGYLVYTSGSTGRPKGIVLEHRGIATTAQEIPRIMGVTSQSRILQLNNLVFDFGLLDIIFALYNGACVCMPSDAEASGDIAGAIRRTGANYVQCTPTYATLFSPQDSPSVRAVVLGGEALRQENLETWTSHARVMDVYGPAEVGISSGRPVAVSESGAIIQDIGLPVGCRYWVVDPEDHDELVPVGTTGELLIEGPIVARGYVNSPQAMAAAFIDAPAWTRHPDLAHMGLGQHRFYKTGDLVMQKAADSFVYESRKDTQVKIRGQRIEMGEIEYHLNRQTTGDTKWVVDAFFEGAGQEKTLAAFCQVSSKDAATLPASGLGDNVLAAMPKAAEAAAAALRQVLPSYMVPEIFIPLRKFPVVGPMKTDRKALRTMASGFSASDKLSYRLDGRQQGVNGLAQPNAASGGELTDLELLLQRTWAALLGVPPQSIRPQDDFFVLGGNSIRAMRLVTALRKSRHRLGVVDVFKYPTLAEMAVKIGQLAGDRKAGVSQKSASVRPRDFPHLGVLAKTRKWLDSSNIEDVSSATDLQALMLAIEHVPDCGTMVATVTLEPLSGNKHQSLDLARLREACEQVIRHHDILRTVFIQNKQSLLQVTLRNPPVKQIHVLCAGETSQHRVSVSSDMLDILPHFDLHSDDTGLLCTSLKLTIHHAHYDAVSLGHLLGDLKNAYAGTAILTRHPSFHEWSSYVTKADGVAEGQAFWRKLLNGSVSHPLAPSGSTRQHQPVSDAQQKHHLASFKVPTANLASPNGTPATVLKAAWFCVLSQVLEDRDIVFSFISANRFSGTFPRGNAEQVAGPCINLVPMRASMNDETKTMATLVTELQDQYNQSLPYQHVGFRSIVKHCTQWPTSRFNSAILFQNHEAMGDSIKLGDTECAIVGVGQGADSADVWISAVPGIDQTLSIELRFSPVKVPVELCRWISSCFESLLNTLSGSWEKRIHDLHEELLRAAGPKPLSPVRYERDTARAEGADPEDVVDRMLQAKHFEYL